MRAITQDVRHALRLFVRNPGFFAVSALTIALAIGGCTAVFSVVNSVLLRPLPYPDPEQIVAVTEEHPGSTSGLGRILMSNHTYHAWLPSAKTVTALATYSGGRYTVAGGTGDAERIPGASVTPSFFKVLGVRPAAGRLLSESDAVDGAAAVVVLGHEVWMSRFGGDLSIVGSTVRVNGTPRTVVGIAQPGFAFPETSQIYTPYIVPRSGKNGIAVFAALARMAPGVTPAQVAAEGTAAARSVTRPPVADMVFGKGGQVVVRAQRLSDRATATVRPALIMLSVGIGLVLIIACANVTNLFLSRGLSRVREMTVRAALGAHRGRLVRQLLIESVLLASFGGLLGIGLAWALTRAVPILAPANFPRVSTIAMDWPVLIVAAVLTLLAGAISGLVPALRGSRFALSLAMRDTDVRTATSSGRGTRALLLATEAALAVVLLIGASLLGRSFARLINVETGYEASNVLSAALVPVGTVPNTRMTAVVDQVLERLRALPGVEAAGAGNMAPFGGSTSIAGFPLPGAQTADGQPVQVRALSHTVSPGYAEALKMRLVEGRFINAADVTASTRALLVNEAFVRTYLTDGRPALGRRFDGLGDDDEDAAPYELVGVVANVLPAAIDGKPEPAIYVSHGRGSEYNRASLLVRTTSDPASFGPALRAIVRDVEPNAVAVDNIATLSSQVAASVATPRFAASVLGAFALLALVLAAVGLYGVLSYNVTTRRREMGVRAALGASRWNIVRIVLAQGLGVTAAGLAAGMIAASLLTRLMQNQLFGIKPLDPVSFIAAPAVLFAFAILACAIPARRATRIDPAEALRAE